MALALDITSLNSRLSREGAQSGAITVSLIWNDPSDLDMHAYVKRNGQTNEDHIFYGHKKGAGGYLDIDMNVREVGKGFSLEPVENIFWKAAPGGDYRICITNAGTKTSNEKWDGRFTDNDRNIPFKVFLNKDGEMKEFDGLWKPGSNNSPAMEAFKFSIEGPGDIPGTGGGGNYIVFPPEDEKVTFKELCSKHEIPWAIGGGFYAVARKEKIQAGKEMLLQHLASDNFTIGAGKCRDALGWPTGELNKGPGDILEGHRLFVQSTSANRVIQPGTHVLFEVDADVYAKHRKTTHIDTEAHTSGTAGMSAAAKAAAKAEAKASPWKGSPKKAAAKAAPPPPVAEAAPAAEDIPISEQHEFLNLAKEFKWAEIKRAVNAKPGIVGVQPGKRWSALHQAAGSSDEAAGMDAVKFLLEAKAPVDATDKEGKTPLDVAANDSVRALLRLAKTGTSPAAGTKRKAEAEPEPKPKAKAKAKAAAASVSGKKIVFTGTLATPRAAATAAATAAGATVLSAVSGNMDILIAGPGAGAKMAKAEGMGKEVWDEDKFKAAVGL